MGIAGRDPLKNQGRPAISRLVRDRDLSQFRRAPIPAHFAHAPPIHPRPIIATRPRVYTF
jgi:hypothetical protein